jgi:hypothetical protein
MTAFLIFISTLILSLQFSIVSEFIWKRIARFIAKRPRLVDWIIRRAQRNPYFHINDYMDRWWLLPRFCLGVDENGNLFPKWWMPFGIRIHHIKREDERVLHDHPFDYRTIIMRGWYDEQDIFGYSNIRGAGQTVKARAQHFHRIATMPKAGVWTLFIIGKKINRWGFIVGGKKIYYRDYLGMNK